MRVHIPRDWTHQRFSRWLSRASKALLVLSFVSLAIQLGALIAMQVECGKLERPETAFGTSGEFSPKRNCHEFYEFPWFKSSFQFFLNVGTAACMVTDTVTPFKNTLTLLRAIAIVLTMDSVNNFLGAYYGSTGLLQVHAAIYFAGGVTLVTWNLMMEVVLATDFESLWTRETT